MKSSSLSWTEVLNPLQNLTEKTGKFLLLLLVASYRTLGTLFLGGACRFQPSCSEYAVEAIHKHSPLMAAKLIIQRILKCRPGGSYGYDPVPECPHCRGK